MSYSNTSLGSLLSIKTGKLDANASSEDGQYPFFTCAKKPLKIDSFSYDCECVLVAGNGDLNVKHYEGKFDAYQRTYILEDQTDEQKIHLRYVYYFLDNYLEKLRQQSIGGIIKYIKKGHLSDAQIPLPPLPEQKRIATILDAADALRSKRRQSIAELDTLLQATFLDMFGDPVTNPKGWDKKPLSQVSDLLTGFAFPSDHYLEKNTGIALCRGINIGINHLNWTDRVDWESQFSEKIQRYELEVGDIVLAMDRPWIKGGLKVASISSEDLPALLVQRVARIRTVSGGMSYLIRQLIDSQYFERHCNPTETTVPHISPKDLKSFPIIIPPVELQREFAAIVEGIEAQKARMQSHLQELDTLFAALQQRAFNGEL